MTLNCSANGLLSCLRSGLERSVFGPSPSAEKSIWPSVFARCRPVPFAVFTVAEDMLLAVAVEFLRTLADVVDTPLVLSLLTGFARVDAVAARCSFC